MEIDRALAIVNAGAASCKKGAVKRTLYHLKAAVIQNAIRKGAEVKYVYRYSKPKYNPLKEHPDILEMCGGAHYWDLIEVAIKDREFHIPVPLASEIGLIKDISNAKVTFAKRKSIQTGSKEYLNPATDEITKASSVVIKWLAEQELDLEGEL